LWGTLPLLGIQNFDKNVATFKEPERCCNLKKQRAGSSFGGQPNGSGHARFYDPHSRLDDARRKPATENASLPAGRGVAMRAHLGKSSFLYGHHFNDLRRDRRSLLTVLGQMALVSVGLLLLVAVPINENEIWLAAFILFLVLIIRSLAAPTNQFGSEESKERRNEYIHVALDEMDRGKDGPI